MVKGLMKVLKIEGSAYKLAKAQGVAKQNVSQWMKTLPPRRAIELAIVYDIDLVEFVDESQLVELYRQRDDVRARRGVS